MKRILSFLFVLFVALIPLGLEEYSDSLSIVGKVLRQPNPKSPYGQMSDKFQDSAFQKEIDSVLRKLNMLR